MSKTWCDYPAAVVRAEPAQVVPALATHYAAQPDEQLAKAYSAVARAVAQLEEVPRGTLGDAMRRHLEVIAAEQAAREGRAAA